MFVSLENAKREIALSKGEEWGKLFEFLVQIHLISALEDRRTGYRHVLESDVSYMKTEFPQTAALKRSSEVNRLFVEEFSHSGWTVFLSPGTGFSVGPNDFQSNFAAIPSVRKSIGFFRKSSDSEGPSIPFVGAGGVNWFTNSKSFLSHLQKEAADVFKIELDGESDFAGTAYYMGSKRRLRTFLIQCLSMYISDGADILDLMCGSGAASGVFAKRWNTFASDAQEFSCCLAKVQGGGFKRERALTLLPVILEAATAWREKLFKKLDSYISVEDTYFHCEITEELKSRYRTFVDEFPLFPAQGTGAWNPAEEISIRQRNDLNLETYECIFSCYYANVFFGVRQAVEIDALRTAIRDVPDQADRELALGALIVACSATATNYGSHFAQPLVRDINDLSLKQLEKILQRRSRSVTHEFSIRLQSLASRSESVAFEVTTISGPWERALDEVRSTRTKRHPLMVYVDAPYTRDEYSRYYHVLETLVRNQYPDVFGIVRIPARGKGRFASEFFTRDLKRLKKTICDLIERILRDGNFCSWSYVESGMVEVKDILEEVSKRLGESVSIDIFTVPFSHKSHGRRGIKNVTEVLTVFSPANGKDIATF